MPTGIAVMLERRKRRPVRLWDIVELIFEFIVQILQMQVAGGINNVNGRISGCAVGPGLTGPGAHLSRVCEFFKRDIFSPFVSGSCEEGSKSGGASGGSFLQDAPPRSWGSPMTGLRVIRAMAMNGVKEWSCMTSSQFQSSTRLRVSRARYPEMIEIIEKI